MRPLQIIRPAVLPLLIAAILGAVLAFAPTEQKRPTTIRHSQVIIAVIGALLLLIVGDSLGRAFATTGIANLIRYRVKIDDPRDSGVMLGALAAGLAAGARYYAVAGLFTVLLWIVLRVGTSAIDAREQFRLELVGDSLAVRWRLERILRRRGLVLQLRRLSSTELAYDVDAPLDIEVER